MRCTFCQAENVANAKFCKACGKPLPVTPVPAVSVAAVVASICSRCQTENVSGAKFCKVCGTSLSLATPVSQPAITPDPDETLMHVSASQPESQPAPAPPPPPPPQRAASVKPAGNFEPQFGALGQGGDAPAPKSSSRAGLWILLIMMFVFLLAVAGAGAWYFLLRKSPENPVVALESPKESVESSTQSTMVVETPKMRDEPPPVEEEEKIEEAVSPPKPVAQPETRPEEEKFEKPVVERAPERASLPPREVKPQPVVREKPLPPIRESRSGYEASPRRDPLPPQPQVIPPPSADLPLWLTELRFELARCASKNLVSKSICVEKARQRFCPGNWNKVRDCEVRPQTPDNVTY